MNTTQNFKALIVKENENSHFSRNIESLPFEFLSKNEVLVNVKYSSLNFKDALSASGNKGITKNYPHIPGIDASGIVVNSLTPEFSPGEEVIITGYDLGMNTFGGFSEYIYIPAKWIVKKPENITLKEAMVLGTSAFTAAIGVNEILKAGSIPENGKVLITGATGAVGSSALQILKKLGFTTVVSTRKESEHSRLKSLGADEIININEFQDSEKGLFSKQWIAAFDTVGGPALSFILKSIAPRGIVTNCGMIKSVKLETSIMPFIIRGVRLVGIAAAETPMNERKEIWNKLTNDFRFQLTDDYFNEITLDELPITIEEMLKGNLKKKTLIKIS